jgi:hypothetical protein
MVERMRTDAPRTPRISLGILLAPAILPKTSPAGITPRPRDGTRYVRARGESRRMCARRNSGRKRNPLAARRSTAAPYGVIRRCAVPPRRVHARDDLRGWTGAWLPALRALRARTYKELHACTHLYSRSLLPSAAFINLRERAAVKSRARECLGNICRNSSVCRTRSSSLFDALRTENVKLTGTLSCPRRNSVLEETWTRDPMPPYRF